VQWYERETDKGISPWTKSPFFPSAWPEARLHAVSLLEPLDAAGGINKLLLTRKEWVTGRADFRRNLGLRGTGLERIAAQTFYRYLGIFWMYSLFHCFLLAQSILPDLLEMPHQKC
jgi:hypothetical protein